MRRPDPSAAGRLGSRPRRAFTLVEILIVVVILGILASIVIGQFGNASQDAARVAFATSLREYATAAERYRIDYTAYPGDGSSGQVVSGFEDYVRAEQFQVATPIGGVWDTEFNDNGVGFAVGVHFNGTGTTRDDAYMAAIDAMIDDGVLTSGSFRRLAAGRYYRVLQN
jgi:general secretion pathway protein G